MHELKSQLFCTYSQINGWDQYSGYCRNLVNSEFISNANRQNFTRYSVFVNFSRLLYLSMVWNFSYFFENQFTYAVLFCWLRECISISLFVSVEQNEVGCTRTCYDTHFCKWCIDISYFHQGSFSLCLSTGKTFESPSHYFLKTP